MRCPVDIVEMALLTDELRDAEGVSEGVNGVYIMEVLSGSSAEDKGISAGDVIVEVNQEGVRNAKDIEERLKALKDDGRKNALLMVSSKEGEIRFVVVRID